MGSKKSKKPYHGPDYVTQKDYIRSIIISSLMFIVALVAIGITYKLVADLLSSIKNPVRSWEYRTIENLEAPGIIIFPIGAKFMACGHIENVVSASKAHVDDVDLTDKNCTYEQFTYEDPLDPTNTRPVEVVVFKGPHNFTIRQALFMHFQLNFMDRNFYVMNMMLFPRYKDFENKSTEGKIADLIQFHKTRSTISLDSGHRQWIKFHMKTAQLDGGHFDTEFLIDQSVVQYHDMENVQVPHAKEHTKFFFVFIEWKTNVVITTMLMTTTTVWSVIASICSILLSLHKGYQIGSIALANVKDNRDKRRKSRMIKSQAIVILDTTSKDIENRIADDSSQKKLKKKKHRVEFCDEQESSSANDDQKSLPSLCEPNTINNSVSFNQDSLNNNNCIERPTPAETHV